MNNFAQMKPKMVGNARCGAGRGMRNNPMMSPDPLNVPPGGPMPPCMNMPPRLPMWNQQVRIFT